MNTSSSTKVELIELISCFNWDNISIPVQTDAINIVGQLPTLLDVTCCVRLHTLLHVVAWGCVMLGVVERSLKPVKRLSQQLLNFLFFRDRRNVAQQCSIGLHSSSNLVEGTHVHYMVHKVLWVAFFPWCTAGPNIVGSCCIRFPVFIQDLPMQQGWYQRGSWWTTEKKIKDMRI